VNPWLEWVCGIWSWDNLWKGVGGYDGAVEPPDDLDTHFVKLRCVVLGWSVGLLGCWTVKVCCKFPWCVVGEVEMGRLGGVVHVYLISQRFRPR
jgi:hypothetical protein